MSGKINAIKKGLGKTKDAVLGYDFDALGKDLNDTAHIFLTEAGPKDDYHLLGWKLNTLGKVALGGATLAGMGKAASDESNSLAMGRNIGVRTPTPSMQQYMPSDISGGASGDLVFALHNNRNRGYL